MQIRNLAVHGFQRIKAFSGPIAPLTLFAGPNESGKSSLREAIAFAFTGEPGRAGVKKNYHLNVHRGATEAVVKLSLDGAALLERDVATGRVRGAAPELPPALPFCLNADAFSGLTPAERRGFLFGLMGIETSPEAVRKRILARGIDTATVDRVMPLLAAGVFEPALQEATRRRVAEKGAWAECTGEPYGEKKAEGWLHAAPEFNETALTEAVAAVQGWDKEVNGLNQAVGRLQAAQNAAAEVPALREQAKGYAAAADRRNKAKQLLAELEHKLAAIPPPPGAAPAVAARGAPAVPATVVPAMVCPHCSGEVFLRAGKLEKKAAAAAAPPAAPPKTEPAQPALDAHTSDRKAVAFAIGKARAEIDAAEKAVAEADSASRLADRLQGQQVDPELAGVPEKLQEAKDALQQWRDVEREQAELKRQATAAKQKTARAKELHDSVQRWDGLCRALSPDGVPAEILGAAMGPFTEALKAAAAGTNWKPIEVTPEMEIVYGGFPYALCSEGAQWRADAMIAYAVARLSGIGVVLLDRFDVLDLDGRGEALNWLYGCTQEKTLNTVILFGTLKALPGMPEGSTGYWLENPT